MPRERPPAPSPQSRYGQSCASPLMLVTGGVQPSTFQNWFAPSFSGNASS